MNTYLENLKKNYFYTIIVGMIISLPLFLVFDILSDETICTEPDYSGDLNECLRITANANEIGWVLFTFPIGMALMSGMFHYFPVIKPTEEQKGGVSFGFLLAFIFSAISVLFITVASGVVKEEHIDIYSRVSVIIPIAIFIIGYRNINGRWFWQEEKKEN